MASTVQSPPPRVPLPPPRPQRSLAGPVVLIVIGTVFLLGTMGVLQWQILGMWFARYWPLLIILWGVIKLVEHQRAQRSGVPARGIGAGGILLLVVLIVFGLVASQAARFNWEELRDHMDMNDGDFPFFGHTYNYDDQLAQNFPARASLQVTNDRGAVNVTVSPDSQIHMTVHKRVSAESQQEADQSNTATKPQITVSGGVVTLNANTHGAGFHWVTTDMDISLPRKAAVVVTTHHGDVSVLGRDGDAQITNQHGEVSATDISGKVILHLEQSSARVSQVASDVSIDGHATDVSVEDVKGEVHLNGDFTENLRLSKIAKAVSFKTARTNLELAKLDGDLDLDSGDLQADGVGGPLRLETHSKDIRLGAVSGDVHLTDANGAVEIRVSKLGSMQVENRQGDIEIYLPDQAAFQLDARAQNGEIYSDFSGVKNNNSNDEAVATGTVGGGGPTLVINNEHGAIRILKGSSHSDAASESHPGMPLPPKPPKPSKPEVPEETEN
jgi:hypothetical protein